MTTLKLIHPKLGVCGQVDLQKEYFRKKVIQGWQQKYGEKFYECDIVTERTFMSSMDESIVGKFKRPDAVYSNKDHWRA